MWSCNKCGSDNSDNSYYCVNCGANKSNVSAKRNIPPIKIAVMATVAIVAIGAIAYGIGTKSNEEEEASFNQTYSNSTTFDTTDNAIPTLTVESTISSEQAAEQTTTSSQETNTETVVHKTPSVEDVQEFGSEITYPQSSSYLPAYETMYVKSEKGDSRYVYWKSQRQDEYRRKNYFIEEKAEVTVLAREKGSSCVIFTDLDGEQRIGWVNSSKLVYEY